MADLDDYDGPLEPVRKVCTCAGTAPGYPQHEAFCGQPDGDPEDPDELSMREWQDTHDAPPEEDDA